MASKIAQMPLRTPCDSPMETTRTNRCSVVVSRSATVRVAQADPGHDLVHRLEPVVLRPLSAVLAQPAFQDGVARRKSSSPGIVISTSRDAVLTFTLPSPQVVSNWRDAAVPSSPGPPAARRRRSPA